MSLCFGLLSILFAIQNQIIYAGIFILCSVILDSFDGYFARKLQVESNFGKQLDSLSDLVSFGVAPLILVYQHLSLRDLVGFWVYPLLILNIWAGAFRLARFNLQPQKLGADDDTLGITITNGGVILSLAVLSDLSNPHASLARGSYAVLLLILSYLMISKLKLSALTWLFPSKRIIIIYIILGTILYFFSSIFTSILVFFLFGLAASISKKIYYSIFQGTESA